MPRTSGALRNDSGLPSLPSRLARTPNRRKSRSASSPTRRASSALVFRRSACAVSNTNAALRSTSFSSISAAEIGSASDSHSGPRSHACRKRCHGSDALREAETARARTNRASSSERPMAIATSRKVSSSAWRRSPSAASRDCKYSPSDRSNPVGSSVARLAASDDFASRARICSRWRTMSASTRAWCRSQICSTSGSSSLAPTARAAR